MSLDIIIVLILALLLFGGAAYLAWKSRRDEKRASHLQEKERKGYHV